MKSVKNTTEVANNDLNLNVDASEITQTVAPIAPVLISDKLTQLENELLEKQTKLAGGSIAPGTGEFTDVMLDLFKLGNEIKTERTTIEKAMREADVAKKRNERIGMVDAMIAAAIENYLVHNDGSPKSENLDAKNAAYAKLVELRAPIDNEMLVRIPHTTASKKAVDGLTVKPTTEGGEKGKAIIAYLLAQRENGATDTNIKKQLVQDGYAVGTVGSVILAWQRENGEK